MKRSRRLASILAVAVLVVALAGTANAVCVQSGRVVYAFYSPGANLSTYWIHTSGAPGWYYVYTTADPTLKSVLANAHTDGKWVTLWGSAGVCPAVGTYRAAGVLVSPWVAVH